ncbi:MAG: hypothetical protein VX501_00480, partial [Pseudomonadota bacterium]|nr:hypothetical protein [Pseudomonadota bacterium]
MNLKAGSQRHRRIVMCAGLSQLFIVIQQGVQAKTLRRLGRAQPLPVDAVSHVSVRMGEEGVC